MATTSTIAADAQSTMTGRSRASTRRSSFKNSRHSRSDLMSSTGEVSLSASASLSNPSLGSHDSPRDHNNRKEKSNSRKTFSFKSVRKSFGSAASFGGLAKSCKTGPKMKFSKLNTPELETLSFPTSSGDSVCSSSGQQSRSRATKQSGPPDKLVVEIQDQDATTTANLEPAEQHPVPLHTCALIAGLAAFFIAKLPSLESLDEVANIDTFTNTVFDDMPLTMVIATRLFFALIMLGNALSVFLYGTWYADTDYFPGSKLRVAKRIPFKGALVEGGSLFGGIKCISTFTLWCWIVEGSAFFLAGMIPLFHYVPDAYISPWVFRVAMVLWEVGAPVSILVSAVVKYALWPMAMEHGENVKLLKATGALLQHNLNSIAALMEVGLLGGLPVRLGDFAFPPLYGICYLLYSYLMMYKWTDPRQGPQFFYPFFDTTLGAATSLCLVALLAILSLSFCIFVGAEHLLLEAEKYIAIVPMAAIVLLSMMVCRVKD